MDKLTAYREVLDFLNGYENIFVGDHRLDIRDILVNRMAVQCISDKFGIAIPIGSDTDYCKISEHEFISIYGDKYNRTIAWSDDGRQPEDERLYVISFPTGAYTFGREYPTKTFNNFFNELKTFGPKYTDTANHDLYFTKETAKSVHEKFQDIYKKYNSMVDAEIEEKKIESLKKELESLQ